jgi:hypothetical protein
MNDVAHCTGENCPIRDVCMRYQVYIKYSNELTTEIGMFVEPGYIGYYCNNFIFKNDE